MKVVISDFFLDKMKKNCKWTDLDFLINKIKTKSKNFVELKIPFFKIRIKTKETSLRILVNYEEDLLTLIFINIFDKKDKKYWNNISWDLHKKEIQKWYESNLDCIEKWKYKIANI